MIVAINMYLQAYHMYRVAALNKPEVKRLDTKSSDVLDTLQKEFPFGVRRADGTLRLYRCTEKPNSMVHLASTYETVGRCRTISANVTESRMKTAVKTKARKTNNQHRSAAASSRPTWRWRRRCSWRTTWTQPVCTVCGCIVFDCWVSVRFTRAGWRLNADFARQRESVHKVCMPDFADMQTFAKSA
jgi:hypothetical protein